LMVMPLTKMLAKAFFMMSKLMAKPLIVNDANVGGEALHRIFGEGTHS
jgi:hypothetical protein